MQYLKYNGNLEELTEKRFAFMANDYPFCMPNKILEPEFQSKFSMKKKKTKRTTTSPGLRNFQLNSELTLPQYFFYVVTDLPQRFSEPSMWIRYMVSGHYRHQN